MPRLIRITCGVALVVAMVSGGIVSAGNGDGPNEPPPTVPETPPVITAEVETPDTIVPGTPGTTAVPVIPCDWDPVPATADDADTLNTVYDVIAIVINVVVGGSFVVQVTFYSEDGVLHRFDEESGNYEYEVIADCDGANAPGGWTTGDTDWWTASDPDPAILLPGTRRQATEPITFPVPDLSPTNQGVVNLGMWLAVEPAGPISVEAVLGRVWARTTATLIETSFDPGNGAAPVICAEIGTPIPDSELESIDEGPCGYTYPSAVEDGEITITSTWSVTWELSDGRTGRDADIVVTTVVPYDVVEIQTVGTG